MSSCRTTERAKAGERDALHPLARAESALSACAGEPDGNAEHANGEKGCRERRLRVLRQDEQEHEHELERRETLDAPPRARSQPSAA